PEVRMARLAERERARYGPRVLPGGDLHVQVVAFDEVDEAYAALEGEGDGSLAYWRAAHWDVFGRECARIGRLPAPDMPVVCCAFEVVAVVPDSGGDPAA
ncbi:MAG: ASCH domain-containing protein, partial [Trueperaceae bacterium]|nr:ASCH domain-containing protein [Trueperaceae bacterium]